METIPTTSVHFTSLPYCIFNYMVVDPFLVIFQDLIEFVLLSLPRFRAGNNTSVNYSHPHIFSLPGFVSGTEGHGWTVRHQDSKEGCYHTGWWCWVYDDRKTYPRYGKQTSFSSPITFLLPNYGNFLTILLVCFNHFYILQICNWFVWSLFISSLWRCVSFILKTDVFCYNVFAGKFWNTDFTFECF